MVLDDSPRSGRQCLDGVVEGNGFYSALPEIELVQNSIINVSKAEDSSVALLFNPIQFVPLHLK